MGHDHNHDHSHGHSHSHEHTAENLSAADRVKALLAYMISHNGSHMDEIRALAGQVEATGHTELAAIVTECVALYEQIDCNLKEVLQHFEGDH